MVEPPVFDAIQSFLLADSWEASQAVVAAEPRLLLPAAVDFVSQLAEEARDSGDERTAARLAEHHAFLERCNRDAESGAPGPEPEPPPQSDDDAADRLGQLLHELATPPTVADMPRRIDLCQQALALLSRDQDASLWGLLHAALGSSLVYSKVGNRSDNYERAIAAFDLALQVLDAEHAPTERAATLNNLGRAYEIRLEGPWRENQERAIAAYDEALRTFPADVPASQRAQTLANLANAYNRRPEGRRDENRDHALELYDRALGLLGADDVVQRAQIQVNAAIARSECFTGNRSDNLERAIGMFEEALDVLDTSTMVLDAARAQTGLATALQIRATYGDPADLEEAIVAHQTALQTFFELGAQRHRALTLNNLGNALQARRVGNREDNIWRGIDCYSEALEILDRETEPLDWAQSNINLGNAYMSLRNGNRRENLQAALHAYNASLTVLTADNAPVETAQALKNQGAVYAALASEGADGTLRLADSSYREALRIREDAYGPDHPRVASVLYSLAKVQRRRGDPIAAHVSLKRAIEIDERSGYTRGSQLAKQYRRLGLSARAVGDLATAEQAISRALRIDEDALGPTEPRVVADLRELATVREDRAEFEGAADALERAVAVEQLSLGEDHPRLRDALERLSIVREFATARIDPGVPGPKTARGGRFARKPPRPVTLRFREELHGPVTDGGPSSEPAQLSLSLEVTLDDVHAVIDRGSGVGEVTGFADCDAFGGRCAISHGSFSVEGGPEADVRRLRYELELSGLNCGVVWITGEKDIHEHRLETLVTDTTTMVVRVRGAVRGVGAVSMGHLDVLAYLRSLRADGATPEERAAAVDLFGQFSMGRLWAPHSARMLDAGRRSREARGTPT